MRNDAGLLRPHVAHDDLERAVVNVGGSERNATRRHLHDSRRSRIPWIINDFVRLHGLGIAANN